MSNLINFSASVNFVELEQRIRQINKVEGYNDRISATVEFLEEISKTTATDSAVYSAGLADQMTTIGNVMAVYAMSKIWDISICGLRTVQSKTSELIDTHDVLGSFYRHHIDAEKVEWFIKYEQNRP